MTTVQMRKVFQYYDHVLGDLHGPGLPLTGPEIPAEQLSAALYAEADLPREALCKHLRWMCQRALAVFLPLAEKGGGPEKFRKAATWLGYVQGELRAMGLFSITELREHNRNPPDVPLTPGTARTCDKCGKHNPDPQPVKQKALGKANTYMIGTFYWCGLCRSDFMGTWKHAR